MVGGEDQVFKEMEEILLCMGTSVLLVGEIGSGNITKLANQIMVAIHLAAMSEAMVFAEKAGVDAEKVFHAINQLTIRDTCNCEEGVIACYQVINVQHLIKVVTHLQREFLFFLIPCIEFSLDLAIHTFQSTGSKHPFGSTTYTY